MPEELSIEQKALVADCARLWEAGELKLKPLAAHYRSVVAHIAAAEARVDVLWRDHLLGGPYGEARAAWQYLADTTIAIPRESAENLEAAGDVLVMAAREYQETERINTDAINTAKQIAVRADTEARSERGEAPGGGSE
ncbi:hypothetical protein QLQ12_13540 [Actinoplanes sp. NEAU-A12]|uniref:Uncharacterized protein n=1 Tax=Actinoplanes sandaracinus TaxID=3045177 RepID=A0ABT6WIX8_9ACTN|nr:hypothetical protein [Actinoplanes sandaracinus]MDI6099620.1 hypothetical protein [Actinoplanes sandaracinus]